MSGPGACTPPAAFWPDPLPLAPARPTPRLSQPSLPLPPARTLPPGLGPLDRPLTLGEVVEIALASNPATRSSWEATRAAAAGLGEARAPFCPAADFSFDISNQHVTAVGGRFRFTEVEQQVMLDLWTAQASLKTAGKRVKTSEVLLQSAAASVDVALGRYRQGLGSIVELLRAQATLAVARAQEIQNRTVWLLSVIGLARALGSLLPGQPSPPGWPALPQPTRE